MNSLLAGNDGLALRAVARGTSHFIKKLTKSRFWLLSGWFRQEGKQNSLTTFSCIVQNHSQLISEDSLSPLLVQIEMQTMLKMIGRRTLLRWIGPPKFKAVTIIITIIIIIITIIIIIIIIIIITIIKLPK